MPSFVFTQDLQARLRRSRQEREQVDVAMRRGTHRTGLLVADQRWIM